MPLCHAYVSLDENYGFSLMAKLDQHQDIHYTKVYTYNHPAIDGTQKFQRKPLRLGIIWTIPHFLYTLGKQVHRPVCDHPGGSELSPPQSAIGRIFRVEIWSAWPTKRRPKIQKVWNSGYFVPWISLHGHHCAWGRPGAASWLSSGIFQPIFHDTIRRHRRFPKKSSR